MDSGRYQALKERGFCVSYGDGKLLEFSCEAPLTLTLVKDRQTEKDVGGGAGWFAASMGQ